MVLASTTPQKYGVDYIRVKWYTNLNFSEFQIVIFRPSRRSKSNTSETAIGALGAHFAAMRIARADLKCILLVTSARLGALAYMCAPWTHVGSLHTISRHTVLKICTGPLAVTLE